jgi:cyclopropane fatty-acyl-phospholipid synthase-like methyltransferase
MDWNARYSTDDYLFGTAPSRFLSEHVHLLTAGDTALCIADGEGRNSVFMAEQGLNVTAWDASPVALDKARKLAESRGVTVDFRQETAERFDWTAWQYDIVCGIFFQFAGPALRRQVFDGMIAATRPGGLILIHGYTPKQIEFGTGGPGVVENLYTAEILTDAFSAHEIVELRDYEAEISEGSGHEGMSALTDLVVRRV